MNVTMLSQENLWDIYFGEITLEEIRQEQAAKEQRDKNESEYVSKHGF